MRLTRRFTLAFILSGLALVSVGAAAEPKIAAPPYLADSAARATIERAVPREPLVKPARPRRLLIFTRNVGYNGHSSIPYANEAFAQMGRQTGAFETVVSDDPAVFARDSLARFDAVFFNNTVGNLFTKPELRRSLMEFVTGGGGVLGVHGSSVAFCNWPGAAEDWPEFGFLLGARGASHKDSDEPVTIALDDPAHPLNGPFGGQGFPYRDEFFRFGEPYSRDRVRVLLRIDNERTDFTQGGRPRGKVVRPDADYALAWVKNHGRGRVFYTTIGHQPGVYQDPQMLAFFLGAVQFALGDLAVPTTPSARLTPAVRAHERLGWKLGLEAYTLHKFTFFETIEKTAQLGLAHLGGLATQRVSAEIAKPFDPALSDTELEQIRLKLAQHGLQLITYYIHDIPADPAGARRIFEFGRKMGIHTFLSEPKPEAIPVIASLCEEYGIQVALHNHGPKLSPHTWHPDRVLELCAGRTPLLGAAADIGYWLREGIDPIAAIRQLGPRLLAVQLHDLDRAAAGGQDVPWGTGAGRTREILQELQRLCVKPTMIGLEYSRDWLESMPQLERCIQFFNTTVVELAP